MNEYSRPLGDAVKGTRGEHRPTRNEVTPPVRIIDGISIGDFKVICQLT